MRAKVSLLAAGAALAAAVAFLTLQDRSAGQTQPPAIPQQPPAKGADVKGGGAKGSPRADDEAAVRKATADFTKVVERGDAKAVAAAWTEHGEYIADDGTTLRGRAAIEAAYSQAFAKTKGLKLDVTIESIRFPSKDTAVEEGYAHSYRGGAEHPTATRYSVLHVREDGRWLMAVLREWPDEGVNLRDLDWLIGTWEAKTPDAQVRTTYEWDANKNSIRCHITVNGKGRTTHGTQILLRDPRTGHLRSWQFDDDGGFGDSVWLRDGKRWLVTAGGVQSDGGEVTATNILSPVDRDAFTWQSTERTLDGVELPNIPPVKVSRVK